MVWTQTSKNNYFSLLKPKLVRPNRLANQAYKIESLTLRPTNSSSFLLFQYQLILRNRLSFSLLHFLTLFQDSFLNWKRQSNATANGHNATLYSAQPICLWSNDDVIKISVFVTYTSEWRLWSQNTNDIKLDFLRWIYFNGGLPYYTVYTL